MTFPQLDWLAIAPEIVLSIGAAMVLLVEVQYRPSSKVLGWVAGLVLITAGAMTLWQRAWLLSYLEGGSPIEGDLLPFGGMVAFDAFAIAGRMVILMVTALGLGTAWRMIEGMGRRSAEAVALVLLAATGFSLMAATPHLVMMFLGLEIGSLSLYVLAGITRERAESDEAALKYFLLGSFASAFFIYGVALLFAGTGRLNLLEQDAFLASHVVTRPAVLLIGLAAVIVGLGFKVSAAPFHGWAPDVYQGAPAGIVGFMAAAAKVGGFAALTRILTSGFAEMASTWAPVVAGMAALSMLVGSFLAAVQEDVRRLLAYSGVAHAGFILAGLVAGRAGIGGIWFYLAVYSVQLVGGFAVVAAVGGASASRSGIADYAGLGRRQPFLALTFTILLLGMAGIPLTSGFIAKFGVFQQAWMAGFEWLVVLAVLSSVVAMYLYLRVIVAMYMRETEAETPPPPRLTRWVIGLAVVATLVLGVVPGPLLDAALNALPL
jgi:NADH-quinone oxidoreductase subunit N